MTSYSQHNSSPYDQQTDKYGNDSHNQSTKHSNKLTVETLIEKAHKSYINHIMAEYVEAGIDEFIVNITNVHPDVHDDELFDLFSSIGRVIDISAVGGVHYGIRLVQFEHPRDCKRALTKNGTVMHGSPINVEVKASQRTSENFLNKIGELFLVQYRCVTITGFPFRYQQDRDISHFISQFGPSTNAFIIPVSPAESTLYITFQSIESAHRCIRTINHIKFTFPGCTDPLHASVGIVRPEQLYTLYDTDPFFTIALTDQTMVLTMDSTDNPIPITVVIQSPAVPSELRPYHLTRSLQHTNLKTYTPTEILNKYNPHKYTCLLISNSVDPSIEITIDTATDIFNNIGYKCQEYGIIKHNSFHPNGNIWLELDSPQSVATIVYNLHNVVFDNRQLSCVPVAYTLAYEVNQWS